MQLKSIVSKIFMFILSLLSAFVANKVATSTALGYDPNSSTNVMLVGDLPNTLISYGWTLIGLIAPIFIKKTYPKLLPLWEKIAEVFNLKEKTIELGPLEQIIKDLLDSDIFSKLFAFGVESGCDDFITKVQDLQEHYNELAIKECKARLKAAEDAKEENVIKEVTKIVKQEKVNEASK